LIKTKHEVILNYIEQFQKFGPQVEDCFSNGMCYQFTLILCARFQNCGMRRVYDPIVNHFAVEWDNHIYDITGDITDNEEYKWVYWDKYIYIEPREAERIRRDCFYKVPSDLLICRVCGRCFEDESGCALCDLDNKPVDLDTPCEKGLTRE
jgi:hypothetical protein